jgi:hypothetical protein
MSFDGFEAGTDAALAEHVIDVLKAGMAMRDVLGIPARIFDDQTRLSDWPFVTLERHEVRPGDSITTARQEHRLQFASASRHGGLSEAKSVLGALRASVEAVDWTAEVMAGQRIVLALVTYSDVMRTRDRRAFRGVFRMRVITEKMDA